MTSSGNQLTVLGIETSCDETACAIVRRHDTADGEILANVVRTQLAEHSAFGGVVPEIAARAHVEVLDGLVTAAFEDANLSFQDIDAVAATAGPGLIGGLLIGMMTAKSIALVHDLPFVAVNHLEGHALTPGLTDKIAPPYLLLLVSGGHTQLLTVEDIGKYKRLGTTIDDALGEAFDKTAKLLGLPYPGGPQVEKWAQDGDPNRFPLPTPLKGREQPNFSFSGLKTALRQTAQKIAPLSDQDIADLCASFQNTIAKTVTDRTRRAMTIFRNDLNANSPQATDMKLVVAGGVAANQYLRTALLELAKQEGFSFHVPPPALCTDNAAMIAWAGAEHFARGKISGLDTPVYARWPLDNQAPPAPGAGVKA